MPKKRPDPEVTRSVKNSLGHARALPKIGRTVALLQDFGLAHGLENSRSAPIAIRSLGVELRKLGRALSSFSAREVKQLADASDEKLTESFRTGKAAVHRAVTPPSIRDCGAVAQPARHPMLIADPYQRAHALRLHWLRGGR